MGGDKTFQIETYAGDDGFFFAECPGLPGCFSQGKSREEAMENLREALLGYIEAFHENRIPIPEEHLAVIPERYGLRELPLVSGRRCAKALRKVGFRPRPSSSRLILQRDDPFTLVAVPDQKTLDRVTLTAIMRQARLDLEEFLRLLG